MIKKWLFVVFVCFLCVSTSACQSAQNTLIDGYYTAEMSDYEHDWKEFVTICVSNDNIVTVEFNARNSSGYIKAWDMDYMRQMNSIKGTYPNAYTRAYAASLLKTQSAENIDAVSGATHSGGNFERIIALLLEKAKSGDTSLGIVQVEN
ncbi:FMN-binding protein [Clostridium aminobutyricum]|uniref:FMN-binding protein n=1 Tax=Clostridium aminobutyricum TaxID=33953 RepID=A0A939IFY9_CLOAM|nr:FMN-binding protein [Clostridium aminobutyricum]MBN7772210.1 FMN-binding protein [Clostridium aminobutyricum]